MLYEFLDTNHDALVKRCRDKVATRPGPPSTEAELQYGIPTLLRQLVTTLRKERVNGHVVEAKLAPVEVGSAASKHGNELLLKGFTVDQVVHDYGDLCQAVMELAHETDARISVDEFHTFNMCLDSAIADAVTEFGRQRDQHLAEVEAYTTNVRLGFLAHELRNLLNSAMLAFYAVKRSNAPVGGATGAVLGRSLIGIRDLIDRSLADVRLSEGLSLRREQLSLRELVDELQIAGQLEAANRGITFAIAPIGEAFEVDADRQMIAATITNLLQNAFKFTARGGHVWLRVLGEGDRVHVEVEDECGGLPDGKAEALFKPFEQRGDDRSGLGLGLSISRRGAEANGGTVSVRDLPGQGCIFTLALPRRAPRT